MIFHLNEAIELEINGKTRRAFLPFYQSRSLDDPRITVFEQENKGKATSLNRLFDVLSGDYIMVHDADGISHPERVTRVVEAFLESPTVSLMFSSFSLIIGSEINIAPQPVF